MRILDAQLSAFRNVASAQLRFSPRLTAFVESNGQGKTNILEALYSVAALRPLRHVPRTELIQAGEPRASVEVVVQVVRTGLTHALRLDLRRGGRDLSRDGKRCEATGFLGHLVAVAFTPDDLELSKGAPEVRRRFLDRALLNARPAYLDGALRYSRALKGRNRLLLDHAEEAVLEAYELTLARAGAPLVVARARFLSELAPRIQRLFDEIARPAPPLLARYRSDLLAEGAEIDLDGTTARFLERLAAHRPRDRHRKTTSVGPHLDDIELRLGDGPARVRASQGQHRAIALAFKLAEIEHISAVLGEPPVLLLDDISSELDAQRSRQLFERLVPLEGQVILTTTDVAQASAAGLSVDSAAVLYDVAGGCAIARLDSA